jgi:hypothetical protein
MRPNRFVGCMLALASVALASRSRGAIAAEAPAARAPVSAIPSPSPSSAIGRDKTVVRRFGLITGASQGGPDRVRLRFASSDARAMQNVLGDLGGLGDAETLVLLDVGRTALRNGFERIKHMVAAAKTPDARTEVIFYYSGHSDETGLLLGGERVSYSEIRAWVDETAADVRIAVLDSCASGALTRGKGGVHRPPFLVDISSAARGHAYLTASAENEAAQESDRLGAAYFTHYLVSGLRGAADVSHDGRVTLGEAYQYAFTETLARTETSRGGAQHASYDFQLAGKGDLVMTDLRATSASLFLPPELAGRLFVRDAHGQLVAEVHKMPAQPIELGLPPGNYRVTLDDNRRLSEATIELGAGKQTTLSAEKLVALAPTASTRRGPGSASPDGYAGDLAGVATVRPDAPPPPTHALNLSLFPPLDTNGGIPSNNAFVFGFGARSANLRGVSLTLGYQVVGDARGLQISWLGNAVGGEARGVQIGGFGNVVSGDVRGLQIAGFGNVNQGEMHGVQVGGFGNVGFGDSVGLRIGGAFDYTTGTMKGLELSGAVNRAAGGRGAQLAGAVNIMSRDFVGLQVGGAVNVVRGDMRGLQIAGAVNVARKLTGGELAVVNVSDEVHGAQIGVVNVARKVRGTQVGLVNVADTMEGASVGLVTFVRKGRHEVDVSSTEVGATVLGTVLGTQHVYTRLGIGILAGGNDVPGGRPVPTGSVAGSRHTLFQWGIGGHRDLTDRWFIDGEIVGTQYYRSAFIHQEDAVTGSVRLLAGVRLAGSLCAVFGPSYNVSVGWNGTDLVTGSGFGESVDRSGQTVVRRYPGLVLGVRI